MQGDILRQGWELMVFGMGTVVVFLGLLVLATGWMSRLVNRWFPEPVTAVEEAIRRLHEHDHDRTGPDVATVAAITAAIHHHRARRR